VVVQNAGSAAFAAADLVEIHKSPLIERCAENESWGGVLEAGKALP